jgi:hypothetical protein
VISDQSEAFEAVGTPCIGRPEYFVSGLAFSAQGIARSVRRECNEYEQSKLKALIIKYLELNGALMFVI